MKSVIELVKTNQGYSIVENGNELNKPTSKPTKQKAYVAPKKFTQQSFTIYPYIYTNNSYDQQNKKYIILPAKSQWFNFHQIHQIEKKALPEWFKTRKTVFGATKPDKFEKNQEFYLKYRNHIIEIGKRGYLSQTKARKGLAGDVCAIIRIHQFLESWGLINYIYRKQNCKNKSLGQNQETIKKKQRKDCIDKDKQLNEKNFDKDHLQLLKKITLRERPICRFCEGICGIVWYEYEEKLFLKTFRLNQKDKGTIENSDQPFLYKITVCASCLHHGNVPILFSIEDFQKKTLLSEFTYEYQEPKDRKKMSEQNKIIETLEKNKFNIKKSAQIIKIKQKQLYEMLICVPLVKIEKMSRIQQQADTQEQPENKRKMKVQKQQRPFMNGHCQPETLATPSLKLSQFGQYLTEIDQEEIQLYSKFTELWLQKILTKTEKLSVWEKSTNWYSLHYLNQQKNKIADTLKKA